MNDRPARFISNHDGDTVTMLLDQGFHDMKQITIRLANVWAPEMDEYGGVQVKAFLEFLCADSKVSDEWPFIVHTSKTRTGNDIMSFGRYVATVMMPDGESLNSKLMRYITEIKATSGVEKAGLIKS